MKVLIIDSDRIEMAKLYLANRENQVYGAFTDKEAIELLNNHKFDYISFGDNLPVVEYMIENKMSCNTARVNIGLIKAKKLMIRLVNGGVTNEVIQSKPVEIEELKEYCK